MEYDVGDRVGVTVKEDPVAESPTTRCGWEMEGGPTSSDIESKLFNPQELVAHCADQ